MYRLLDILKIIGSNKTEDDLNAEYDKKQKKLKKRIKDLQRKAGINEECGNYKAAIDHLRECVDIYNKNPTYLDVGYLLYFYKKIVDHYQKLGDLKKATEAIDALSKQIPRKTSANYIFLAGLYKKIDDIRNANLCYHEAFLKNRLELKELVAKEYDYKKILNYNNEISRLKFTDPAIQYKNLKTVKNYARPWLRIEKKFNMHLVTQLQKCIIFETKILSTFCELEITVKKIIGEIPKQTQTTSSYLEPLNNIQNTLKIFSNLKHIKKLCFSSICVNKQTVTNMAMVIYQAQNPEESSRQDLGREHQNLYKKLHITSNLEEKKILTEKINKIKRMLTKKPQKETTPQTQKKTKTLHKTLQLLNYLNTAKISNKALIAMKTLRKDYATNPLPNISDLEKIFFTQNLHLGMVNISWQQLFICLKENTDKFAEAAKDITFYQMVKTLKRKAQKVQNVLCFKNGPIKGEIYKNNLININK